MILHVTVMNIRNMLYTANIRTLDIIRWAFLYILILVVKLLSQLGLNDMELHVNLELILFI